MSVTEIKNELKVLPPEELDQIAALILQLRRSHDPDRALQVGSMIDDPDVVELDTLDRE